MIRPPRRSRLSLAALALAVAALAGCEIEPVAAPGPRPAPQPGPVAQQPPPRLDSNQAVANFRSVVQRVEPIAERTCRAQTRNTNCDFNIVVDTRRGVPPNAFQTLDRAGRPVIGLTRSLILDTRNQDELAFILSHEAAHHIEGHIPQAQQSAAAGGLVAGVLASMAGLDADGVQTAQNVGASVNARRFSVGFELEADRLGTIIASRAGYNPVRGAEYFQRIPDPGDRFLASHPPNGDRIRVVRETAAGL